MSVEILYFAWLRSRVGTSRERLELPAGTTTIAQLMEYLAGASPGHGRAFADREVVRAAVNQSFVEPDHPVRDGDEIAFFPPITGG